MSKSIAVPFNKPYVVGSELDHVRSAMMSSNLTGDNKYTMQCNRLIESVIHGSKCFLTPSGTASLELSALIASLEPGDEVILPSYTFVSTANAFVLRGCVPVFVDVRADTMNIDEQLIEQAITERTRAVVVVHYAGVACEMDQIVEITKRYGLLLVEDAAQAYYSEYKGKSVGSLSDLSCISFHGTKNISCGEGGAICVNRKDFVEKTEIIREKGTDRAQFLNGNIDKYTWRSLGSSFLMSELSASYLYAQLQEAPSITALRRDAWQRYHLNLAGLEDKGLIERNVVPSHCKTNAHIYFVVLHERYDRNAIIALLRERQITAVSHYEPLHISPFGAKFCKPHASLPVTEARAKSLLRLPLWPGINVEEVDYVISCLEEVLCRDVK